MFPSYYTGPYGTRIGVAPAYHRKVANEPQWHDDPFDPDEDRWPGDRYLKYTWSYNVNAGWGWHAPCYGTDDSGGV